MRLLGRNEFGFRLPFALAGLGIIFVAWAIARRLFDGETGRIAALILAATPYFISQCHSPSQDLFLSFFTGLALLLWLVWKKEGRPWSTSWWGFYVSLSLACLFNGAGYCGNTYCVGTMGVASMASGDEDAAVVGTTYGDRVLMCLADNALVVEQRLSVAGDC